MRTSRHSTSRTVTLLAGLALLTLSPRQAVGQSAPGYTVTTYATLSNPYGMTFATSGASAGTLFVGRDEVGTDGLQFVRQVAPGGGSVANYGTAIYDADTVLFDPAGVVSGVAGSVLVGGVDSASNLSQGRISFIRPNQTVGTAFGPATVIGNPEDMELDSTGRFLFTNAGNNKVLIRDGQHPQPAVFISIPATASPRGLAIGPNDAIYVNATDGVVRAYNANGTLRAGTTSDGTLVTGVTGQPLEYAASGPFAGYLYGTTATGDLLRVDLTGGTPTVIGTGFGTYVGDITFGPDGALYLSDFNANRILRVGPAPVPEPALVMGTCAVAALAAVRCRKLYRRMRGATA